MKVKLIDYTGFCSLDPLYAARLLVYTKSTRLEQGDETRAKVLAMHEADLKAELEYVANTVRSSWEFVDFTFEIGMVTRAFTHQLVRTRTASYAQQAQRVVNMGEFDTRVPQTVHNVDGADKWDDLMEHIARTYQFYQEKGVPNQDCRGVLPTNVYTNIITKMNLRTLADIAGKRLNLRAQDEYTEVVQLMVERVYEVMPWTKPFIQPDRLSTPALDKLIAQMLGTDSPVDHPLINQALKEIDKLKAVWG